MLQNSCMIKAFRLMTATRLIYAKTVCLCCCTKGVACSRLGDKDRLALVI